MNPPDPHNLARFVAAQRDIYDQALQEIRAGQKRSHWMWFIFPQFAGLGSSAMAREYAIKTVDEARAYLAHPVLGARLVECATSLLTVNSKSANDVFGSPDDMKLRSSATLFAWVSSPGSTFEQLLDRFFKGERDEKTVVLMGTPGRT